MLLLVPMLVMSVWSATPHSHAERRFAPALPDVSSTHDGAARSVAPSDSVSAALQLLAPVEDAHPHACGLCEWMSVAGACWIAALSITFLWLRRRASVYRHIAPLLSVCVPLELRARAPPIELVLA